MSPELSRNYPACLFAFTARPFDKHTGLQNNLNRWYDATTGQWLSEDPLVYELEEYNLYRYVHNSPTNSVDPEGLADCNITIYGGHNFSCLQGIEGDYPNGIPPTDCVTGVGCAIPKPGGGGTPLPIYLCRKYPDNAIPIPGMGDVTNPLQGVKPNMACAYMKMARAAARRAADRMSVDLPANPNSKCPPPHCDTVTISIKCDKAMSDLFEDGTWHTPDGRTVKIPERYWKDCHGMCGSFEIQGRGTTM